MSNALTVVVSMPDMEKMAAAVAKSGLFGVKEPDKALALMLLAQAEGLHPMSAVQQFHIINGTPARKSWSMLERFQSAGGKVEWKERTDTRVVAVFSHPQGGSVEIDWTMDRAKKAQISNPMWSKYPRQMMTARVISEGVRTVFPGATGGFYAPEEVSDMKDITPPKPKAKVENKSDADKALRDTLAKATGAGVLYDTPPHDADTGEIFPPSDNVGGDVQTVMRTTPAPERTDEAAKAEAWCNEAIRRLDAATSAEAIDGWLAKNKQMLARMRAANDEAAMAVVSAADYRRRQLEPVG